MRYLGGKSKIAKPIADKILSCTPPEPKILVSLFCGTCSVEGELASHFEQIICNDKHPYLIAMLRASQNFYEFPSSVSEDDYKFVKEHKEQLPALAGFIGFGCSFGAKWFDGYARGKKPNGDSRNYANEAKVSLEKTMSKLRNKVKFTNEDYKHVNIPKGAVVYADPPYKNTQGYSTGNFDSDEFWNYIRELALKGIVAFVSELEAPKDFVEIWHRDFRRQLNKGRGEVSVEKLFVHNSVLENRIISITSNKRAASKLF